MGSNGFVVGDISFMCDDLAPEEGGGVQTTLFHRSKNYRVGNQPISGSIVVGP